MSLTLILDIAYAVVLLVCLLIGIFKGWTKTLLGLILVFVAGFVANWFAPLFAPTVKEFNISFIGGNLRDFVASKSHDFIVKSVPSVADPVDVKFATEHNLKAIVCGTLSLPVSIWKTIYSFIQPNIPAATQDGKVYLDVALSYAAGDGACFIVAWLLAYIVIYVVGLILINIVLFIIKKVRQAKSEDGKAHRPAWSRLLGAVFGLAIGASMIIGVNTTAHLFVSIDQEGNIFPLEKNLGIEDGKQTSPSVSGWIYLATTNIGDTFFPSTTSAKAEEENLNNIVITLDAEDPTLTLPSILDGAITSDNVPAGMESVISTDEDGRTTITMPTTKEGYDDLVSGIAAGNGISEEEVASYLEAAGVTVTENEDGTVSYEIDIPTDPTAMEDWMKALQDVHSGEGSGEGEGNGGGE